VYQPSPVTRTKCVSILSYLSRLALDPILPLIPVLAKQSRDDYWELKGQLLILCSNSLLYFNQIEEADEDEINQNQEAINETMNEHSKQSAERKEPKSPSKLKHALSLKRLHQQIIDQNTPILFDMIHTILTPHAPKATIKIGLIYLAKILDYYPDYTSTYL